MATVTVRGLKELDKVLKELPGALRQEVVDTVNKTALAIQRDAKKACPVRKAAWGGRLRASIRPYFYEDGMAAEIGTNVHYAQFVEFGTGRRGASGTNGESPMYAAGYRYGSVAGMHAQPYLFPALEMNRGKFFRDLSAVLKKVGMKYEHGAIRAFVPTGGTGVATEI